MRVVRSGATVGFKRRKKGSCIVRLVVSNDQLKAVLAKLESIVQSRR